MSQVHRATEKEWKDWVASTNKMYKAVGSVTRVAHDPKAPGGYRIYAVETKGPMGPTGARGPTGAQGSAGAQPGDRGPTGVRGPRGPRGPVGPQPGDRGPTGARGPTGGTGAQGSQSQQDSTGQHHKSKPGHKTSSTDNEDSESSPTGGEATPGRVYHPTSTSNSSSEEEHKSPLTHNVPLSTHPHDTLAPKYAEFSAANIHNPPGPGYPKPYEGRSGIKAVRYSDAGGKKITITKENNGIIIEQAAGGHAYRTHTPPHIWEDTLPEKYAKFSTANISQSPNSSYPKPYQGHSTIKDVRYSNAGGLKITITRLENGATIEQAAGHNAYRAGWWDPSKQPAAGGERSHNEMGDTAGGSVANEKPYQAYVPNPDPTHPTTPKVAHNDMGDAAGSSVANEKPYQAYVSNPDPTHPTTPVVPSADTKVSHNDLGDDIGTPIANEPKSFTTYVPNPNPAQPAASAVMPTGSIASALETNVDSVTTPYIGPSYQPEDGTHLIPGVNAAAATPSDPVQGPAENSVTLPGITPNTPDLSNNPLGAFISDPTHPPH